MSYRFAAYSLPHLAVNPHVAISDQLPVDEWAFEQNRQRHLSTLSMNVPSFQTTLLNQLLYVNPDDHTQDIGSIIHAYRDGIEDGSGVERPAISFFLDRRPDRQEEQATETSDLTASHLLTIFDYARLYPYDYPAAPSAETDWRYGAPSILNNGDLESGGAINDIQAIVLDATAGTWEASFEGSTATGLAFNITSSALETALETAWLTVIDLSVSGSGTTSDPFLVEFLDPGGLDEPAITVDGSGLTGTVYVEPVQTGGTPGLGSWTKSLNLTNGREHGTYASDGFRVSSEQARTGTYSLRVNGLSQFAGAQQIVSVVPNTRYVAEVWVYTSSAVDEFRLVVRDRFENLVAWTTPIEQTVPPNTWTLFQLTFTSPPTENLLVFRFAYVGTGNPAPFFLDDMVLYPGAPPAPLGSIWLELLADIQTDHAADFRGTFLTWVVPTFTATLDSAGNAWPGDHSLTLNEGSTYLQLMEHFSDRYGYEFDLRYDQDADDFKFDIFNPGNLGTSHPSDFPAIVVGGGVTGGEAVRSAPMGNAVLARGADGIYVEMEDASMQGPWDRREGYVSAREVSDTTNLTTVGSTELARWKDSMIGLQYQASDVGQSIPMLHFEAADYVTTTPGDDTAIPSGSRRIESIRVRGRGGLVNQIDVHVGSEVFGSLGLAAQAEAVRRLLRKMQFQEPVSGGAGSLAVGGLTVPPVIAAPDSPADWINQATYMTAGDTSDTDIINEALLSGADVFQLAPGTFYLNDVAPGPVITIPNNVRLYAPANMGYRGSSWQTTFVPWFANTGVTWFRLGANATMEGIYVDDSAGGTVAVELAGGHNQVIRNCWLAAGDSAVKGTTAHDRVRIEECYLHAYNDTAPCVDLPFNNIGLNIHRCSIEGGTHCVNLGSGSSGFVQFHITDCDIGGPSLDSIRAQTSGLFGFCTIADNEIHGGAATGDSALIHLIGGNPTNPESFSVGCHIHHNSLENGDRFGIWLEGADHTRIDANLLEEIDRHGVLIDNCFAVTLTGNVHRFTGRQTGNTYDMIQLLGTTDDVRIVGDEFHDHPTSTRSRYAINISAASVSTTVYLVNSFNGAGQTASVNNAGTGTINTFSGGGIGDNIT